MHSGNERYYIRIGDMTQSSSCCLSVFLRTFPHRVRAGAGNSWHIQRHVQADVGWELRQRLIDSDLGPVPSGPPPSPIQGDVSKQEIQRFRKATLSIACTVYCIYTVCNLHLASVFCDWRCFLSLYVSILRSCSCHHL